MKLGLISLGCAKNRIDSELFLGVAKQYKMGNYVPSLATRVISNDVNKEKAGLHEQDDDRLKVVITPPTGVTTYIIRYTITTLVTLTVAAIRAYSTFSF